MSLFKTFSNPSSPEPPLEATSASPATAPDSPTLPVGEGESGHVHVTVSVCPHCAVAIHTVATEPPTLCPYCQRPFDRESEDRPIGAPFQPPTEDEVKDRMKRLYRPFPPILTALIVGMGLLLLAWTVYLQFRSLSNFWYQPLVASYSIIAGLFVITRFIFAAFYHAPAEQGYNPTVTVLIPCFNEGEAIRKTIECIFASGYPEDRLEVVCVNDGSKDDSLSHILAAQTRHPRLVAVDFRKNRGLCHGWTVGTLLAKGEIMVCIDSDTFVFPGAIHKVVQGFTDPTVGGISGHCDVENANVNMLTRMQDVRYYFSYKIMKAAESVFGTVSCLPGCFSAYRRECVAVVLDSWLNAKVLGSYGNFADDRSLTNCILRNYKILYDDEAIATTIAPENWRQYTRQQARWARSYLREIWKTGKYIWRKHPVPALSWYAMMWMPIIEPFVMFTALVIAPVSAAFSPYSMGLMGPVDILFSYLIGVFAITAAWALHFLYTTGRRWWYGGFLFTLSYMVFYSWQIYWALLTLRERKWGTRR